MLILSRIVVKMAREKQVKGNRRRRQRAMRHGPGATYEEPDADSSTFNLSMLADVSDSVQQVRARQRQLNAVRDYNYDIYQAVVASQHTVNRSRSRQAREKWFIDAGRARRGAKHFPLSWTCP